MIGTETAKSLKCDGHLLLTGTIFKYAAARFAYSFSSKPVGTQISSVSAYSATLKASVYISMDFVHSPSLNTSFPSPKRFHTRSLMKTWKFKRSKSVQNTECSWFVLSFRHLNFGKRKSHVAFHVTYLSSPKQFNSIQCNCWYQREAGKPTLIFTKLTSYCSWLPGNGRVDLKAKKKKK